MLNHRLGARASWFTDVHKPPAVKSTETGSAQLDGGLSIILEDGVPAGEPNGMSGASSFFCHLS